MAYVYRHIRLDKNEPFYIGIGKRDDNNFARSRATYNRNPIWNAIVQKTKYEVEILMDGLTFDEAKVKEIEFIVLYGRICDGSGILSNLSLGGDGVLGLFGKLNGNYGKPDKKRRPVLMFRLDGKAVCEFESLTQAANEMGLKKGVITSACIKRARRKTYGGYIWEYKENVSPEWVMQWIGAGIVEPFYGRTLPPDSFKIVPLRSQVPIAFGRHTPRLVDSRT